MTSSGVNFKYEPMGHAMTGIGSCPSYVDMISQMFRYWRGGTKIKFSFYGSPLMSYEITLTLFTPDAATVTDTILTGYRKVLSCRGTVHYDFDIPFIYTKQWRKQDNIVIDTDVLTYVRIELTQAPHSIGATIPYPLCVLSQCASEDFQLRGLRSCNADRAPVFAEAQMFLRDSFKKPFENFTGGSNAQCYRHLPEDDLTVEDIITRYSTRYIANGHHLLPTGADRGAWDNFDYVISLFRYVRGSYRLKIRPTSTNALMTANMQSAFPPVASSVAIDFVGNGWCGNYRDLNHILECEIPFYYPYDWLLTKTGIIGSVPGILGELTEELVIEFSAEGDHLIAAGSGFQLAFLLPPVYNSNNLPVQEPI
jgi:hypothetical protein